MEIIKVNLKLWTLISILFWSCQTEAQRPRMKDVTPEKLAEIQTQKQAKALDLDAEKTKQLNAINLKYSEKLKALKSNGRLTDQKEELKAMNEAQNNEIQAILSADEFKAYKNLKNKQRTRLRASMQQKRKRLQQNRQDQMQRLNLNEEQLEQMKAIRMKYAERRRALRKERVKQTRQELKDINDSQNKEVKAILSDTQYQEYLKIMQEQRQRMKEKAMERRLQKREE